MEKESLLLAQASTQEITYQRTFTKEILLEILLCYPPYVET